MGNVKGTIFNIQRFSVHDGPGIRTVVFVKGCPLRCKWCANPESQNREIEVAWTKSKCIACKSCEVGNLDCEPKLTEQGLLWDKASDEDIARVDVVCPTKAFHTIGYEATPKEVLEQIDRDEIFYSNLDGGLTVSGGEPLMQPEFTYELLSEAKNAGINTAIETTGYAATDVFLKVASKLDYLLMDIKSVDDDKHRDNTGVSNKVILENFLKVREAYPNLLIHVRTPVIPGVNDTEEEIKKISDFLRPYDRVRYELLKYHRLGESKYESLNREYPMGEVELPQELYNKLRRHEFDKINNTEITGPYEGI